MRMRWMQSTIIEEITQISASTSLWQSLYYHNHDDDHLYHQHLFRCVTTSLMEPSRMNKRRSRRWSPTWRCTPTSLSRFQYFYNCFRDNVAWREGMKFSIMFSHQSSFREKWNLLRIYFTSRIWISDPSSDLCIVSGTLERSSRSYDIKMLSEKSLVNQHCWLTSAYDRSDNLKVHLKNHSGENFIDTNSVIYDYV